MSSEQSKTGTNEGHSLDTEPDQEAHQDGVPDAAEASTDEPESVEAQLAQAQKTIKDYWEQMMRLRAEIDNNRKRAERDLENAHKYALKNLVENLLPIIDSMEMGQTAAAAENATLESIHEGSTLTMKLFIQVLERNGLEQIDPIGENFDPERHQAISMLEAPDAVSNTVIEVMQKGFSLNDRLVRPAMVVVAK